MKKSRLRKALLIICVSAIAYFVPSTLLSRRNTDEVVFAKCTDGDTARFLIDGKETTVRFLAVDTPETKHPKKGVETYGPEASEFTCSAISNATSIRLEYESSNKVDKYDRTLAWVFVDDQLLQLQLVENGLAKVAYTQDTYSYLYELNNAETKAKSSKIGLWDMQ